MIDLEALLYKNDDLVIRYSEDNNVNPDYALKLFLEMKKFLISVAFYGKPVSPSKEIDKMWHAFILYTRDYTEWCQKYFGYYIHHNPGGMSHPVDFIDTAESIFNIDKSIWLKKTVQAPKNPEAEPKQDEKQKVSSYRRESSYDDYDERVQYNGPWRSSCECLGKKCS